MPGRSSSEREALARQNAAIMAVFERAGFDHIAPDIIQPADIFLERSGEDIRARTFVFNDPEGNELCLRPDLTVPACRYHLSHATDPVREARYCYLGPAFRFPDELLSPQEFHQAGLEWFGGSDPIAEEARVIKLTMSALEAAGLTGLKLLLGDLGLFNALLSGLSMPERWRQRLQHQFWRPQAFHALLQNFASPTEQRHSSASPFAGAATTGDMTADFESFAAQQGWPRVTDRTPAEIAERLQGKLADRSEQPLPPAVVEAIETYLAISCPLADAARSLAMLPSSPHVRKAVQEFEARIAALEDQGLNPRRIQFKASFGRELEYYTGLVFQVEVEARNAPLVVAGGGRYNNLLKDLGALQIIPAVGCAIHAERVQVVLA